AGACRRCTGPGATGLHVGPRPVVLHLYRDLRDGTASSREPPPNRFTLLSGIALVQVGISEVLRRARGKKARQELLVSFDVDGVVGGAHSREIRVRERVVAEQEPGLTPGAQDALKLRIALEWSPVRNAVH